MKYLIFAFGLIVIVLSGCEEPMDVEFNSDGSKKLVVEGGLTTDTTSHEIKLSWTSDYFSNNGRDMAEGAVVSITDGVNVFTLEETAPGIYHTQPDVFGKPDNSYTLHVSFPNGSDYEATDTLSPLPEIDSIIQSENYNHNDFSMGRIGYGYDILYYGPETPGMGNSYMWNLYLDDKLYTDTIVETIFTDDAFVDGNYIHDFDIFFVRDVDVVTDSVKVTLEMLSISKGYLDYLYGLFFETIWRGSPWDGPPANVPSNVNPESCGFFKVSDVKRKSFYLHRMEPVGKE